MKLNTVVKQTGGKGYRGTVNTLKFLGKIAEVMAAEPEPIDWSDMQEKEGYSKKAFLLLSDYQYRSEKRKLFDKIMQSEKSDRYAYYHSFDDNETQLCETAVAFVADLLDHDKSMTEIAMFLNLQPKTVLDIVKFFNDTEEKENA